MRARSPRLSQQGPCLGQQRRGGKKNPFNCKQVFLSAVACSTPHCQLSTQTCLSNKREGKADKLDKPLAHPSTWTVSGVHGEGKGGKRSRSWFVLMVYSWDKQIHSQALCVLALSFKGGKGRRRNWRWFKGTTRTIKEEGRGSKGSKRNAALFQQVTLHLLTCVRGWHMCLRVCT